MQTSLGMPKRPLRAKYLAYDEMPGRYQDVRERVPDTTKARALLGFEAKVGLAEGLAQTLDWHAQLRDSDALQVSS